MEEKKRVGEGEEWLEMNKNGDHVSAVSLRLTLLPLKEGGVLASTGEIRLCEKEEKQPVMMSQSSQTSATSFLSAEEELKTKEIENPLNSL